MEIRTSKRYLGKARIASILNIHICLCVVIMLQCNEMRDI